MSIYVTHEILLKLYLYISNEAFTNKYLFLYNQKIVILCLAAVVQQKSVTTAGRYNLSINNVFRQTRTGKVLSGRVRKRRSSFHLSLMPSLFVLFHSFFRVLITIVIVQYCTMRRSVITMFSSFFRNQTRIFAVRISLRTDPYRF